MKALRLLWPRALLPRPPLHPLTASFSTGHPPDDKKSSHSHHSMTVRFTVDTGDRGKVAEVAEVLDGELTKLRSMQKYLLEEKDFRHLVPAKKIRNAYHGEPPRDLYSEMDVLKLAVKKHGSKRALEKAQQRLARANILLNTKAAAQEALLTAPERKREIYTDTGSMNVVLTAIAANAIDASCKMTGWVLTGSHSLFAEFVHSCADTANQVVIYVGIRNSAQRPDRLHPYGYANVRYVTSLISGVGIFFVGTGLNCYHGLEALWLQTPLEPFSWAVCLLGVSFITQGTTIFRAYQELSKKSAQRRMTKWDFVKQNEDPSLNVVLFEDSASIVGVGIAGGCIGLSYFLDSPIPDAIGSIVIGGLLGAVASKIISANASHLVGRSIPEDEERLMVKELETDPAVKSVHDVKATEMGADQVRFKAEIDFDGKAITQAYLEEVDVAQLLKDANALKNEDELRWFLEVHGEAVIDKLGAEVDRIEQELKRNHPDVRHVDLEAL